MATPQMAPAPAGPSPAAVYCIYRGMAAISQWEAAKRTSGAVGMVR